MKKLIATTAMLMLFTSITSAEETNQAYANCIAEAGPIFGSTMTIENLRQYMKDHPTCTTAAGKSIEYPVPPEPAQGCNALPGSLGSSCRAVERMMYDYGPCLEMSKRGLQAEANRCHKETRELLR